jgi:chromosomal replication initiation ATPase DnaA
MYEQLHLLNAISHDSLKKKKKTNKKIMKSKKIANKMSNEQKSTNVDIFLFPC